MHTARAMKTLQHDLDSLRLQVNSIKATCERRAALEWENVVCELRMQRDWAVHSQRKSEKRARDANAASRLAHTVAQHARAEAKEAQEAVRLHASEMLVALDLCVERMAEDAAKAAAAADSLLHKERAHWAW